jgi:hypothetical protein
MAMKCWRVSGRPPGIVVAGKEGMPSRCGDPRPVSDAPSAERARWTDPRDFPDKYLSR